MKGFARLLALVMLLNICIAAVPVFADEAQLEDGLVMHYDFESGISDGKIVSANGSGYDATAEGVEVRNGVAEFSGKGTMILPENYATEMTGSYSVAMWVNIDESIKNNGFYYRFFDFGGNVYSSHFLRYVPSSGQLSFMDRGTASGNSDFAVDTKVKAINDGWTHVALVYDFAERTYAKATIYVNGVEVANSRNYDQLARSVYDAVGNSSTKGYIGRTQWANSDNPDFKGKMDDIRIYNRAFSTDEISELYENAYDLFPKVVVKFVDRKGEKLKDDVTYLLTAGEEYVASEKLKSEFIKSGFKYRYNKYRSTDKVTVSAGENVCTLVFDGYALSVGTEDGNLISNPSFEESVDGWTANSNGQLYPVTGWTRSDDVAMEGNYSLKRVNSTGSASALNLGTYIPITPGQVYKLSFYEYSSADIKSTAIMSAACVAKSNAEPTNAYDNHLIEECGGFSSWYNEHNAIFPRDLTYNEGWNYREYIFDTTNVPDANYVFIAYAWGTSDDFYIDAFSLTSNQEPVDLQKGTVNFNYVFNGEIIKTEAKEGYVGYDVAVEAGQMEHNGKWYLYDLVYKEVEEELTDIDVVLEEKIFAKKIVLNKINLPINFGESIELSATVLPENATFKEIEWTSSDESVATVKDGTVTAVGMGECVIRATNIDNGVFAECNVWVEMKGTTGDVEWLLKDGVFTVSGNGKMGDYEEAYTVAPWNSVKNEIKKIVIEDGVTHIGDYTFRYCENLEEVEMADSVESIGESALRGNTNITRINISKNVTTVEKNALAYSTTRDITLPEGLVSVGESAFEGTDIAGVVILDNIEELGIAAFTVCPFITDVVLGDKIKNIPERAFSSCITLKNVTIGSNVESIGKRAFYNSPMLEEISIPDKVKTIGEGAFEICRALKKVSLGNNVETIRKNAFNGCESLTSVKLPDSVKTLGDYIFYRCTKLSEVELPSEISEIPSMMFYYAGIESINIPLTVKKIGSSAFSGCKALKDVYYEGSDITWNKIKIDSENDYLYLANLHYERKDIEKISVKIVEKSDTKVKALFKNETDRQVENACIYAVQYENDIVTNVILKKVSFERNEEKEIEFSVGNDVRIFVWDIDMKPIIRE